MCGLEYCQTCQPNDFITAWTDGRHHKIPMFGDSAQRMVAERKRYQTYTRVLTESPSAAMTFPEFLCDTHRSSVEQFAIQASHNFDHLLTLLPAFTRYFNEHPRPHKISERGKRGRKLRKRANRAWRQHCIVHFVLYEGGIEMLRQMHVVLGRKLPEWLMPAESTMVMAMAA